MSNRKRKPSSGEESDASKKRKDICDTDICKFVKSGIDTIVKNPDPMAQKEMFNAFYIRFLDKDEFTKDKICEFTRIGRNNNLHPWSDEEDYTPLTEKLYNMFTFYVTTLCQGSETCDYEKMMNLQKTILVSSNSITLEELQTRLNDINPDSIETEVINNNNSNDPNAYLMTIATFFNTAFDTFYSNAITPENIGTAIDIVNYFLQIMVSLEKLAMNAAQNISNASVFTTSFGILNCYNNFLISAIGNKLATILNSLLLAVTTIATSAGVGYLAINDTLNDQFLLTTFARLYYYTQIAQGSSKATLELIKLGDIIKLYLMKTFPDLVQEKIEEVKESVMGQINELALPTKDLSLEYTEKRIENIIDFTKEKVQEEEAAAAGEKEAAENNMNVAAAGDNIGGGTRKKRTSRKGKKKASKNRKTKARRARKSRKTKK